MSRRRQLLPMMAALLLSQLLLWWPGGARAVTTCSLSNATLAFGTVGAGQLDGIATFTLTCTSSGLALGGRVGVAACIGLGSGSGGTTLTPLRFMRGTTNTTDQLGYQLYFDPTRTSIWGLNSGSPSWPVYAFTYPVGLLGGGGGGLLGGTVSNSVAVYGRIPVQTLSAGNFASTLSGGNVLLQYAYNEPVLLGIGDRDPPPSCSAGPATAVAPLVSGASTLTVNATVAPRCTTYVATDMDFGSNTGAVAANIDRTSTVTLNCINRTAYTIGLNNGANADTGGNRRMRVGTSTAYVGYELYRDAARTLRWGTSIGTDTVPGTGNGSAQPFTVYGRVPPTGGLFPAQGTYTDVITVNITY